MTRLPGLDILRFVAIALVLGRHLPGELPETWPTAIRVAMHAWIRGGWVGVDLFFVLSGFLVSGLLWSDYRAHGSISVKRFYLRRAWKIYPPFLVLIVATSLGRLAHPRLSLEPSELFAELTFLQNYLPGLWPHTWSLAVEEHFYLYLPFLATVLLARRVTISARAIVTIAGITAATGLVVRVVHALTGPDYRDQWYLHPTHLRADALLVGAALGYLYHFHHPLFLKTATTIRRPLLFGVACFAPPFLWPVEQNPVIYTVGLSILTVGSAFLVLGVAAVPMSSSPLPRLAGRLGRDSYATYLWHVPVRDFAVPAAFAALSLSMTPGRWALAYLVGSLVAGMAMAWLIERPTLRLRDRWFPDPSITS